MLCPHAARGLYKVADWRIDFSLHPIGSHDDRPERAIGLFAAPAKYARCEASIVKSLKKKASKYGSLPLPYVIGVNCTDEFTDIEDVYEALFGKTVYTIPRRADSQEAIASGVDGSGFWFGRTGYKNRGVSGVLVTTGLVAWTIGSYSPTLWLHPEPRIPFEHDWLEVSQKIPNHSTAELDTVQKQQAATLLGTSNISLSLRSAFPA